jgi:prevent-host-death family protein
MSGAIPYDTDMDSEKRVSSTELDRRPGRALLEVVRSGEPVIVTRNGTPIARITPFLEPRSTIVEEGA